MKTIKWLAALAMAACFICPLRAAAPTATYVKLAWDAAVQPMGVQVYFRVYSTPSPLNVAGPWTLEGSTSETTFTVRAPIARATCYCVKAVSAEAESLRSNIVCAVVLPQPVPPPMPLAPVNVKAISFPGALVPPVP